MILPASGLSCEARLVPGGLLVRRPCSGSGCACRCSTSGGAAAVDGHLEEAGADLLRPALLRDDGLTEDLRTDELRRRTGRGGGRVVRDGGPRNGYGTRGEEAGGHHRDGKAGSSPLPCSEHEFPLRARLNVGAGLADSCGSPRKAGVPMHPRNEPQQGHRDSRRPGISNRNRYPRVGMNPKLSINHRDLPLGRIPSCPVYPDSVASGSPAIGSPTPATAFGATRSGRAADTRRNAEVPRVRSWPQVIASTSAEIQR